MRSELYKLFPTPVLRIQQFLTAEECECAHQHILTLDLAQQHSAIVDNGVSSHNIESDIIHSVDSAVPGFAQRIQSALDEYAQAYRQTSLHVSNSWYSIQNQGSILKQHLHSNSIASAVVYVNSDKHAAPIYFDNPNRFVQYTNQVQQVNELNFEYYYFDAVAGDMLIFPSWLSHGSFYQKNESQGRTIISLNAQYD